MRVWNVRYQHPNQPVSWVRDPSLRILRNYEGAGAVGLVVNVGGRDKLGGGLRETSWVQDQLFLSLALYTILR